VSAISASGLLPLYRRRLAVTGKTVSGVVGWLVAPTLWILVVGPALDAALGTIRRAIIPLANALGVLTIAWCRSSSSSSLLSRVEPTSKASPAGLGWFTAAAVLLSLGTYGIAESLALRIGNQEGYGPLLAAVGVTPWFLSGAIYPLAVLPDAIKYVAYRGGHHVASRLRPCVFRLHTGCLVWTRREVAHEIALHVRPDRRD
jgi:hypothetical protein